jgi:hypothetical protein
VARGRELLQVRAGQTPQPPKTKIQARRRRRGERRQQPDHVLRHLMGRELGQRRLARLDHGHGRHRLQRAWRSCSWRQRRRCQRLQHPVQSWVQRRRHPLEIAATAAPWSSAQPAVAAAGRTRHGGCTRRRAATWARAREVRQRSRQLWPPETRHQAPLRPGSGASGRLQAKPPMLQRRVRRMPARRRPRGCKAAVRARRRPKTRQPQSRRMRPAKAKLPRPASAEAFPAARSWLPAAQTRGHTSPARHGCRHGCAQDSRLLQQKPAHLPHPPQWSPPPPPHPWHQRVAVGAHCSPESTAQALRGPPPAWTQKQSLLTCAARTPLGPPLRTPQR